VAAIFHVGCRANPGWADLCREREPRHQDHVGEKGDQPAGFVQLCSPSLAANSGSRLPTAAVRAARPAAARSPASTSSKPFAPAAGPPLAGERAARTPGILSVMRPCHSWTQGDTAGPKPPPRSDYTPAPCGNADHRTGSRITAPDSRCRALQSPQPADRARSDPPLAHSHRERSAGPLPDTHQTRHPGTPVPGLTWGLSGRCWVRTNVGLADGFTVSRSRPTGIATDLLFPDFPPCECRVLSVWRP
jgi:hypothetical protein